jgi:hypothetical protein
MTDRAQIIPPKIRTGRLYTKIAANLAGSGILSVMETMPVGLKGVDQKRSVSEKQIGLRLHGILDRIPGASMISTGCHGSIAGTPYPIQKTGKMGQLIFSEAL